MQTTLSAADQSYLSRIRRQIHQHPELAYEEYQTSALIEQELRSFGIDVQTGFAKTGVIGVLRGGKPGPVLAFRADMDALPIHEQTGASFASQHAGKMHACGHDAHCAMLLTAAKILSAQREQLAGTLKFIFQPAEEMRGGGKQIIEDGALRNPDVDFVYAMHVWPDLPVGNIGFRRGAMMASIDAFEITLKGMSGHGAAPHQGIDAVLGAAHLICALQSIVSRENDPLDSVVVSIGKLEAGQGSNIIAEQALLTGNIRTINPNTRRNVLAAFERMVGGMAQSFRLQHHIRYTGNYPVTQNHPEHAEFAASLWAETQGESAVCWLPHPSMASEDFAYYLEQAPGTFMFLGVNDGAGGSHKLHHECFLPDESALCYGVSAFLQIAAAAERLPKSDKLR